MLGRGQGLGCRGPGCRRGANGLRSNRATRHAQAHVYRIFTSIGYIDPLAYLFQNNALLKCIVLNPIKTGKAGKASGLALPVLPGDGDEEGGEEDNAQEMEEPQPSERAPAAQHFTKKDDEGADLPDTAWDRNVATFGAVNVRLMRAGLRKGNSSTFTEANMNQIQKRGSRVESQKRFSKYIELQTGFAPED